MAPPWLSSCPHINDEAGNTESIAAAQILTP